MHLLPVRRDRREHVQNGRVQNTRGYRDKGVVDLPLRAAVAARRECFQDLESLGLEVGGLDVLSSRRRPSV
jgi:hypothetical protein